jgi:hypothetical protein
MERPLSCTGSSIGESFMNSDTPLLLAGVALIRLRRRSFCWTDELAVQ